MAAARRFSSAGSATCWASRAAILGGAVRSSSACAFSKMWSGQYAPTAAGQSERVGLSGTQFLFE